MRDKTQFSYLAEKYLDTVYRVAFSYIRSAADAEDVTQNVFLKLLKSDTQFESDEHAKYWLIRVAVNECKNVIRSKWWHQPSYEEYAESLKFDNREQSDLFYSVMELPKKYRIPIYLHYYEGYTLQEIGTIMQLSPNTVGSQLRRGCALLRKSYVEVEDHAE